MKKVTVQFFSYFKDLAGCSGLEVTLTSSGTTVGDLMDIIYKDFPKLAAMRKSTLIAVGIEYQDHSYVLQDGDEVSFFPPVQGG